MAGDAAALQLAIAKDPTVLRSDGDHAVMTAAVQIALHTRGDGQGPLSDEHLACLGVLVDAGADPTRGDGHGTTPMQAAVLCGATDVVELLIDRVRELSRGEPESLRRLMVGGLLGQVHGTPLVTALFYANTTLAKRLAHATGGALPDDLRTAAGLGDDLERFVDEEGRLQVSARPIDPFCFRPLEAFGELARPLEPQHTLDLALTYAARNGQRDAMAWLVAHGADVNANPYRGTSLLWAVYADQVEAAEWLLDHGADPDLRHDFGGIGHGEAAVAMHLAAQYGQLRVLRLLLARGADPTIRDGAFNATPLEWAEHEANSPQAAAILKMWLPGEA